VAKTPIKCAACDGTVIVIGRNRREADKLAVRRRNEGAVCAACYEARRRDALAAATAKSAEQGLPALNGSPKQAAWAERIRRTVFDLIDMVMPAIDQIGDRQTIENADGNDLAARREAIAAVFASIPEAQRWQARTAALELLREVGSSDRAHGFVAALRRREDASWWIDRRELGLAALAGELQADVLAAEAPPDDDLVQLQAEAREEALLRPAAAPANPVPVEISYIASHIRIATPGRHDDLRQLLRDQGYQWYQGDQAWLRPVASTVSSDRLAEIAHRILAIGFMVALYDPAARQMAIAGNFTPERRRWIRRVTAGNRAGWFSLSWSRGDDLYSAARRLRGAIYSKPNVLVPARSFEQIEDFAARYDFALSEGARLTIEHFRSLQAAGAVIDDPKVPEPVVAVRGREDLKAGQFVVADDLLDHD